MERYENYRKDKVLRYLDSFKNNYRKFPPSLQVALTDRCFNKCSMCGHWKRKDKMELNIDAVIRFLTIGYHKGLETVCYSGGDPFAYGVDSLSRLLDYHEEFKIPFGFITSGFLSGQHISLIDKIANAEWIRVSLDAIDSVIYEKCRGGVKSPMILKSMYVLREAGANVCFGVTVTKDNIYHIPDILRFATLFGTKEVRLWVVRENPDLEPSYCALRVLSER